MHDAKKSGLDIPSSGPKASMKKRVCSDGKHEAYLGVAVTLALTIVGCSVSPAKQSEHPATLAANLDSYPSVDQKLGEHLYPDEKPIAEKSKNPFVNNTRQAAHAAMHIRKPMGV